MATARKLNGNGTGTERNYPSRCTDGRWELFLTPTVYVSYDSRVKWLRMHTLLDLHCKIYVNITEEN